MTCGGAEIGPRRDGIEKSTSRQEDPNDAPHTPLTSKQHFPEDPDAPIFPKAAGEKRAADGESRRLSAQFHALLVKAGLVKSRPKDKNSGKGHSVKRTVSELTFHSLRHNTTSWLKRAGVPESVVRDIIGHESELVSREYTHLDDETKRKAIRNLPDISKKSP